MAHHYHACLHDEGHVKLAIPLFETVLETVCRRHAPRRAALNNLVAIPLTFDRTIGRSLVVRLNQAYDALLQKNCLVDARIRWVLIRVEIREKGYTEARRRRLLTVRSHLVKRGAFGYAGQLTLDRAIVRLRPSSSFLAPPCWRYLDGCTGVPC